MKKLRIKKCLKKTLIAATLAAMSTSAMAAAIVATTSVHDNVVAFPVADYSAEGIVSEDSIPLTAIGIQLAGEYSVGDVITFDITGGTIDTDNTTAVLTLEDGVDTAGADTDTLVFGELDTTASKITFRVTELVLGASSTTIGATVKLDGVNLVTASAANTTVKFSAVTASGSFPLDSSDPAGTKEVVTVTEQFTSSSTKFDAVIDINQDRQNFVGATSDDEIVITVADADGVLFATATKTASVITADFSFLDTDASGDVSAAELTAGVSVTATSALDTAAALNAGMTELSFATDDDEAATVKFTVAGVADDNPVLTAQSFSVDTTVSYTDHGNTAATKVTASAASAGAWTLNGSQITFPYAPVGYDHIVTNFEIANSSSLDAEISLDAFDSAGNAYSAKLTKVAGKKSLTSLTGADIADAFGLTKGTKLSLVITVNAIDDSIKISGYSNLNNAGRMAMLSDAYEGKINPAAN